MTRTPPPGKFAGVETLELFDAPAARPPAVEASTERRPPAVRYGPCPSCEGTVARELDGEHLVLRPHDVHTYGGASWPCRGSGLRVCQVWEQRTKQPAAQQCSSKCYRG